MAILPKKVNKVKMKKVILVMLLGVMMSCNTDEDGIYGVPYNLIGRWNAVEYTIDDEVHYVTTGDFIAFYPDSVFVIGWLEDGEEVIETSFSSWELDGDVIHIYDDEGQYMMDITNIVVGKNSLEWTVWGAAYVGVRDN